MDSFSLNLPIDETLKIFIVYLCVFLLYFKYSKIQKSFPVGFNLFNQLYTTWKIFLNGDC